MVAPAVRGGWAWGYFFITEGIHLVSFSILIVMYCKSCAPFSLYRVMQCWRWCFEVLSAGGGLKSEKEKIKSENSLEQLL